MIFVISTALYLPLFANMIDVDTSEIKVGLFFLLYISILSNIICFHQLLYFSKPNNCNIFFSL